MLQHLYSIERFFFRAKRIKISKAGRAHSSGGPVTVSVTKLPSANGERFPSAFERINSKPQCEHMSKYAEGRRPGLEEPPLTQKGAELSVATESAQRDKEQAGASGRCSDSAVPGPLPPVAPSASLGSSLLSQFGHFSMLSIISIPTGRLGGQKEMISRPPFFLVAFIIKGLRGKAEFYSRNEGFE